ncbi:DUF4286 family protein [Legionella geestiana]|nr:DUF4286 family protein [Legionella geestiana]
MPTFLRNMWRGCRSTCGSCCNFRGFSRRKSLKEVALNAPQHAFTVHYRLQNRDSLEHYFKENAAAMREDGLRRFGGRFSASRRILELVKP